MSFSFSSLASAAGIPGAAYIPSVFLGSLPLGDFALPETVKVAIQQQFTTHKLPGGGRVFDNTGPDPEPIEFKGIFLGPQAALEMALLQQMQDDAVPVTLAWSVFNFDVLIEHVGFDIGFNRVDYSVRLLVVPDGQDDDDGDDMDLGDGEAADTPAAQQASGQNRAATAREVGGGLSTPSPRTGSPSIPTQPFGRFAGSGVHDKG